MQSAGLALALSFIVGLLTIVMLYARGPHPIAFELSVFRSEVLTTVLRKGLLLNRHRLVCPPRFALARRLRFVGSA